MCSRYVRLDYARGGGSSGAEVGERGMLMSADTTAEDACRAVSADAVVRIGRTPGAHAAIVTH